jgi:membrane-associated phospholipid phosphatase
MEKWLRSHTTVWRTLLFLTVVVVDMAIFWLISYNISPGEGNSLRLALDDRIPFLPWTIFLYSSVYTASAYPLFVVRCPRLFRRTVNAFIIILVIHLIFFVVYPVAGWDFRPDVAGLPADSFAAWGIKLTFFIDPPTNLFPSQHVSMAVIALMVAWRARTAAGLALLPIVIGICISISTVKQHYFIDGIAGIVLAIVVYWFTVRPYDDQGQAPHETSFTWRGPAGYFFLHLSFYTIFFVLYLSGFRPWEGTT